jgi:protein-S-isoprenylcysteine O-methyltransferase Ste14
MVDNGPLSKIRRLIVLTFLLALTVPVTAVALLYARWEYRKRGKLTLMGTMLLCAMLIVPNVILEFSTTYKMPDTPLDYFGVFVGVVGLLLCLFSITTFNSLLKVLCFDPGTLATTGPYKWSRNPQYVGWFLFLLGFSLTDWSLWCLAVLLVVAISLHLLVLVEEEHLRGVFGEQYVEFQRAIPRYAGWGRLRI